MFILLIYFRSPRARSRNRRGRRSRSRSRDRTRRSPRKRSNSPHSKRLRMVRRSQSLSPKRLEQSSKKDESPMRKNADKKLAENESLESLEAQKQFLLSQLNVSPKTLFVKAATEKSVKKSKDDLEEGEVTDSDEEIEINEKETTESKEIVAFKKANSIKEIVELKESNEVKKPLNVLASNKVNEAIDIKKSAVNIKESTGGNVPVNIINSIAVQESDVIDDKIFNGHIMIPHMLNTDENSSEYIDVVNNYDSNDEFTVNNTEEEIYDEKPLDLSKDKGNKSFDAPSNDKNYTSSINEQSFVVANETKDYTNESVNNVEVKNNPYVNNEIDPNRVRCESGSDKENSKNVDIEMPAKMVAEESPKLIDDRSNESNKLKFDSDVLKVNLMS